MPLWPQEPIQPQLMAISNVEHWAAQSGLPPDVLFGIGVVAGQAIYSPIRLTEPVGRALFVFGPRQGIGPWDLGLYSEGLDGQPDRLIASTGGISVVASTTRRFSVPVDAIPPIQALPPGNYWLAASCQTVATNLIHRIAFVGNNGLLQALSVFYEANAFPLPLVATPLPLPLPPAIGDPIPSFNVPLMGLMFL